MKVTKTKSVSQVVSIPRTVDKTRKSNGLPAGRQGHANGTALNLGINSRNFQTRFEPRYKKILAMPEGLETPTFSESANRILKERYLLKAGNLEVAEGVAERFWF